MSIDGTPIATFDQLRAAVAASEGRALLLQLWRPTLGADARLDFALTPRRVDLPLPEGGFDTRFMIGVTGALAFQPETRTPGAREALTIGAAQTGDILRTSLSGLWHMIAGQISSCNLSGPIGIAETSGQAAAQGGFAFVWFIAMLSAAIGLMNLFPIPVLDGGHLVFHAWEAVTGRPPADRVVNAAMTAGIAMLVGLMVFAVLNDVLLCP
jgi:regulator of sigma E protease